METAVLRFAEMIVIIVVGATGLRRYSAVEPSGEFGRSSQLNKNK
jgi:hypothetical protein